MVSIYLAEGFEEIEAVSALDVLRRGEVDVQFVSTTGNKLVKGAHGVLFEADVLFDETTALESEMHVLPGGMPGALNLQNHEGLKHVLCEAYNKGAKLAAICAAPMVLAAHGLLEGKCATIYPGMEQYLGSAIISENPIVIDGNIITGQGPAYAAAFGLSLLEELRGGAIAKEVARGMLYA